MTLDEIKALNDDDISVESLLVTALDEGEIFKMTLITDSPDLPIRVEAEDGQFIKIPNRDIPQFIKALAMMCNENYM